MNEIRNARKNILWKQWMAGITATLTIVCSGTANGWITTNMPKLMSQNSPITITPDQSSWIVGSVSVGNMIGSIVGATSADIFGRKKALLLASLFYATGWLIIVFATTAEELYVSQVILGIGIGISFTTNPMYISEIANVNIRGALSCLIPVNTYTGALLACSVGPFVTVRILSIILLTVPILFTCLFIWFPETPYYLVSKEKYVEAAHSVAFFKGISDDQEIRRELDIVILMVKDHSAEQNWCNKFRDMRLPNNRKALGIVVFLIAAQIFSGFQAMMSYLEVIFQSAKIEINSSMATVIVLLTGMFFCILTAMTIDKVGRRASLLVSTLGSSLILIILASYLNANVNGIDMTSINWIPVFAVLLFQLTYQLGLGPGAEIYIGELFPTNVKSIGSALGRIVHGILSLIIIKFYQAIADAFGQHVGYYIFAIFCSLAFLFSLAFIPETMNKDFKEIQNELTKSGFRCCKKQDVA